MTRLAAALAFAAALVLGCSSTPRPPAPAAPIAATEPASSPIEADELEDARVAAVELRGLDRISESRARLALAVRAGDGFEAGRIRESLRKLMAIDGVADARAVAFRAAGDKIGIAFAIREAPAIAAISITGNRAIGRDALQALARLEPGQIHDPVAATRAAAAIKDGYAEAGHYRAEVSWKTEPARGGVALRFAIAEGPRASIARISFPGAPPAAERRLRALLVKASPENVVGGVYLRDAIENAAAHIAADYYDRGHVDVKIGTHRVETPTPEAVEITIPIEEGRRYRIGKLTVSGDLAAPERDYRRQLRARRGQIFNRSAIARDIERLGAFHAKRSRGSAPEVTPLTAIDPDKRLIDINFAIAGR